MSWLRDVFRRRKFTAIRVVIVLAITFLSCLVFKTTRETQKMNVYLRSLFARSNVVNGSNPDTNNNKKSSSLAGISDQGTWKIQEKIFLVIGSNYRGGQLFGEQRNATPYVLLVPRFLGPPAVKPVQLFLPYDKPTLRYLVNFLDRSPSLDGVFGENDADRNGQFDNNVPCSFSRRETTLLVRNSGQVGSSPAPHQLCNVTTSAFLIRTEVFQKHKWVAEMGILAFLHFFVKAEGQIRLGKLSVQYSQDELDAYTRTDRGLFKGGRDFIEYQEFGIRRNILRLVYEDRVEWTHCAAHWALCKEVPYAQPQSLPRVAVPICCSACLDVYLQDIVQVLTSLNTDYRVVFGTLLGGIRSKAIIPWTYDVDIGLPKYWNKTLYKAIQEKVGQRYWVGFSYIDTYRMHARFPPSVKFNFSHILKSDPDALFTREIKEAIERLSPITMGWRNRGYIDFYESPPGWFNGVGTVTINGRNYKTVPHIEQALRNWYGNFRNPILGGQWVGRSDRGQA